MQYQIILCTYGIHLKKYYYYILGFVLCISSSNVDYLDSNVNMQRKYFSFYHEITN